MNLGGKKKRDLKRRRIAITNVGKRGQYRNIQISRAPNRIQTGKDPEGGEEVGKT